MPSVPTEASLSVVLSHSVVLSLSLNGLRTAGRRGCPSALPPLQALQRWLTRALARAPPDERERRAERLALRRQFGGRASRLLSAGWFVSDEQESSGFLPGHLTIYRITATLSLLISNSLSLAHMLSHYFQVDSERRSQRRSRSHSQVRRGSVLY